MCKWVWDGERGNGPKWAYAWAGFWDESLNLDIEAVMWALRLGFEPRDWDLSLITGISASRLEFEPQGLDFNLEAGIKASRLGFEPQGWHLSYQAKIWASKRMDGEEGGEISPEWKQRSSAPSQKTKQANRCAGGLSNVSRQTTDQ